jgi:hypothetical protein
MTWSLRRLRAVEDAQVDSFADVLMDCVEGGAWNGLLRRTRAGLQTAGAPRDHLRGR